MSKIMDALNTGWIVSEVATVLAHGRNDEGRGFLVTLSEPNRHMLRKEYLPFSDEAQKLLNS